MQSETEREFAEMDVDKSRKRKGGATGGSPPTLKRQNSCPNLKESSLASTVLETKYVNVGDIIVKSFSDKKFIEKITPVLTAIVAPPPLSRPPLMSQLLTLCQPLKRGL